MRLLAITLYIAIGMAVTVAEAQRNETMKEMMLDPNDKGSFYLSIALWPMYPVRRLYGQWIDG